MRGGAGLPGHSLEFIGPIALPPNARARSVTWRLRRERGQVTSLLGSKKRTSMVTDLLGMYERSTRENGERRLK